MRGERGYIPEIKKNALSIEEREKGEALIDLINIVDVVTESIIGGMTVNDKKRYASHSDEMRGDWSYGAERLIEQYFTHQGNPEQKKRLAEISEILGFDWETIVTEHFVPALIEKKRMEVIMGDLYDFSSEFYTLEEFAVEKHFEDKDYDWFLDRPSYSPKLKRVIDFLRNNGLTEEDKILFAERVGYFNRGEHIEIW